MDIADWTLAFAIVAIAVTAYLLGYVRGYKRGVEEWGGKDCDERERQG